MLSPDERILLVDLLAAPEAGFRLERAVATTFTLGLTALLPIPLALAGSDLSSSTDPLSVLQAIRTYADRIDVFCQAGHVSVPAQRNDLLAFLEPMVHQVRAPKPGHLFHPKLWVLRFVNEGGDERYRLVCGSRNLTDDRSWDAVISLDGLRAGPGRAVNRPVAELLVSLAGRVPTGVPAARRRAINELAQGLRHVEWERPEGVVADDEWLAFHVFGPDHGARPNMNGYRRLIVSPFLNAGGLDATWPSDTAEETVVVSRAEELNNISGPWREQLDSTGRLCVFDESAAIPDLDSDGAGPRWSLSGLHAKLYVVERSSRAHVYIGSANATDAAWNGNDELLVEIVGRVATYGVAAALGSAGFGDILLPHDLGDATDEQTDEELWRTLENALRDLASLAYTVTVEGARETPMLSARSDKPMRASSALPPGTRLTIEPLTLAGEAQQAALDTRLDKRWQLSEMEEITPFLTFRLSSGPKSSRVEASTVVLARLIGDPADRLDRVLARQIRGPAEFVRFITLLLQLAGEEVGLPENFGLGIGSGDFLVAGGTEGLLEAVLAALAKSPQAIDDIDRLVNRLARTDKGRNVLPPGWAEFWAPVVAARSQLKAAT